MTTKFQIRTFSPDQIEIREDGDGREVYGRAVPYGVDQEIYPGLIERFEMGCFAKQVRAANRVFFTRDHYPLGGSIIGKATMLEEKADGLYGAWRVSDTSTGNETLTLLRDKVLDELSIGFVEGQSKMDGNVTVRKTATLFEVAVVVWGAYGRKATAKGTRGRFIELPDDWTEQPTAAVRAAATVEHSRLDRARQMAAGLPPLPL